MDDESTTSADRDESSRDVSPRDVSPRDVGSVVAVLLAAGGGTRFQGNTHKLLNILPASETRPPEAVITRTLSAVLAAAQSAEGPDSGTPAIGRISRVVVVTGAAPLTGALDPAEAEQPPAANAVVVVNNPKWAAGQATSLTCGIEAADALGADVVVVGLGDQPGITSEAWRLVAAAAAEPDAPPINVATYDGQRRNPVALHRSIWEDLDTTGDAGARTLMRLRPELVRPIPSPGSADDIDTVEDLERWLNN